MAGDDLAKGSVEASATGVFGTARKEASREEPVRVAPAAPMLTADLPAPALHASSGGFTQLLRALNYDAVKEIPAVEKASAVESTQMPAVVTPAVGGPITQLLRTMGGTTTEAAPVERPVVSASSSQVTSFLPHSAPVPEVLVAGPAPAQAGGSFTRLFQRLEVEPAAEPVREMSPATPSFTQMFQVLGDPAAGVMRQEVEPVAVELASWSQGAVASAPASAEVVPGLSMAAPPLNSQSSFTQMFQALDSTAGVVAEPSTPPGMKPLEVPVAAASGSSSSSFTQMFQTLEVPAAEPVRREETVSSVVPAPGSYTQLFQGLGMPAAEEARSMPPVARESSRQASTPAPGSFTQMFQTLSEKPRSAPESDTGAASSTRLFGDTASSQAPAASPAPSSYERPIAERVPDFRESGASQMFATYQEAQPAPMEREPVFSPIEPPPVGRSAASSSPDASTLSSGGLTQLLRTLDQPTPSPTPLMAPSYAAPVAPAPQGRSFTGMYGELGRSGAPPSAPVAPSQGVTAQGPSEFTRLIQASALREAGLRGDVPGAIAPVAPSASAGGGFAIPGGMPAVPHASFGSLSAPSASLSGPSGAHGSLSAAGGGQASITGPHVPTVPGMSQVRLPEAAKAGDAPTGLHKYLPLLLILVILLLVAILVAVVVLMKK